MINPKNSPWFKSSAPQLPNNLKQIALAVTRQDVKYFDSQYSTIVLPQTKLYLTSSSMKFRLKGNLDWAHYTDQSLAYAINQDCVEDYYQIMLTHTNSDPNVWKHKQIEHTLKLYYANRADNSVYYTKV